MSSLSGIYLHIPFCKQACYYCDFHFSTNLKPIDQLIDSMETELSLRQNYLQEPVKSIYFGGGTPSLVSPKKIEGLLNQISKNFTLADRMEITMEANPDDIESDRLKTLWSIGVNRLSLGIQTFNNEKLAFIHRAHDGSQALKSLEIIRSSGFENITADLIYGIPPHHISLLEKDLETLLGFDLPHLSVYGLTIEEGTPFGTWVKQGKMEPVTDDQQLTEYKVVIDSLINHGYEHYEVSNFAKPGRQAIHNTAYWKSEKYLGVGPGAHSFDGQSRAFNVQNNHEYISLIRENKPVYTEEQLSKTDRINEYIMTRLRTVWGVDLDEFEKLFNQSFLDIDPHFTQSLIRKGQAKMEKNQYCLTRKGWFVADEICSRLFIVE